MNFTFKEFSERKNLVVELAEQIGELLTRGIQHNGRASLAVSGGSTPVELFERLSGLDISWQDVVVILVDERWVEPAESDSNEHLVREHLLKNRAAAATFIGMKNSAATAGAGEQECELQLQQISRPFDVLILGMGGDGHTASLFPGAEKLAGATDMDSGKTCMGIAPLTAPHERMTLTLPAILDSGQIYLHITGQEKNDVLQKALKDGPVEAMPIRFILRQQTTPVTVFWAP
ncbi:MAG: 6-phosphogluconolactonase [Thermodesulfobacteriota bacterium]|nr:6-phosphogluconolactonase [Thermodesulfobacteriota bacterium]